MYTAKDTVVLENAKSFAPLGSGVAYTDESGARVFVPYALLIRLYDGARCDVERRGDNWDAFCSAIMGDASG